MKAKIEFFSNFSSDKCRGGLPMDEKQETSMKAKIEFFSNFSSDKCRGGLSMDEITGNSNESKN